MRSALLRGPRKGDGRRSQMRKLKLAMYVSLDGVVENPAWTAAFWDDELAALQAEYLYASDALVLGRVTYEGFAAAWPGMEESTGEFGRKMNSMPKYVASRTLTEAEWNASIIQGELGPAVAELKAGDGGDLLIYGSGELVDELTRLGLIDEYRLMLHPVLVGTGRRIFNGGAALPMRLVDSRTTSSGVDVVTYVPAGDP
jgi:dihydrofolate reductase